MKQTAVEWLWDMLLIGEFINDPEELLNQAKAMEKEQIIEAHSDGRKRQIENSEQYYNETFKSENVIIFMAIDENSGIESITLTDNPDCGIKGITFKSE